jgi:flagellar basal body-associated protein FliL
MMFRSILLDAAPDPVSIGVVLAVVLLVVGFIVLLAAGLVVFLWYRKRSLRGVEMIRSDESSAGSAPRAQPNNPNQP